jgi:hypothetical protein
MQIRRTAEIVRISALANHFDHVGLKNSAASVIKCERRSDRAAAALKLGVASATLADQRGAMSGSSPCTVTMIVSSTNCNCATTSAHRSVPCGMVEVAGQQRHRRTRGQKRAAMTSA